jgi:hypothetical protein
VIDVREQHGRVAPALSCIRNALIVDADSRVARWFVQWDPGCLDLSRHINNERVDRELCHRVMIAGG